MPDQEVEAALEPGSRAARRAATAREAGRARRPPGPERTSAGARRRRDRHPRRWRSRRSPRRQPRPRRPCRATGAAARWSCIRGRRSSDERDARRGVGEELADDELVGAARLGEAGRGAPVDRCGGRRDGTAAFLRSRRPARGAGCGAGRSGRRGSDGAGRAGTAARPQRSRPAGPRSRLPVRLRPGNALEARGEHGVEERAVALASSSSAPRRRGSAGARSRA